MTRQLDEARHMVENNRQQLERSNVYLESVLSNLSSGVLVFDELFRVTMFNQGAQSILRVDLRSVKGRPLETADGAFALSQLIRQAFAAHAAVGLGGDNTGIQRSRSTSYRSEERRVGKECVKT